MDKRLASSSKLNWPLAPYAVLADPDADAEDPPCTVVLRDGKKLPAKLVEFDPSHEKISVVFPDRPKAYAIKLSDVKRLQLDRQVTLFSSTLMTEAQGISSAPVLNACSLEFKDGEVFEAETFGAVELAGGVFLYTAAESNKYVRHFIPAQAIKKHSLGPSLGRMLVSQNIVSEHQVEHGLQLQQELRERRLGDYLVDEKIVSPQQLVKVLSDRRNLSINRLGEALLEAKLITQGQLDQALKEQKKNRSRQLGSILVEMGLVDELTITRLLARKLGIPFISLSRFSVDASVIALVPKEVAVKHNLMPLGISGHRILIAMENPLLYEALNEVRYHAKKTAEPVMASGDEIRHAIKNFYGSAQIDHLAEALTEAIESDVGTEETVAEATETDTTLTRLVNKIIVDAHAQGASDIHIETYPGKKNSVIRFRKDGVMMHYFDVPASYRRAMVSRIKIMANLDIAERRRGQDGKINFAQYGPVNLELRVATIPTINGLEDVVLRLLAGGKPIPLDKIALSKDNLSRVKDLAQRPYGMFLVCGPTGSGKTTTLHSVLGFINNAERKIWTAEDPVEITQDGLRQVQVNPKIGWTFATTLRSFLRADPDVIMVGEMRDGETAQIGVEASLTGHMVLSTLHTNSAVESVVRLLDLGVDSFNVADAMLGVLSQRLTRRLCPDCKQPHAASREEIDALIREYCEAYAQAHCPPPEHDALLSEWHSLYADKKGIFTLYAPKGCPACDNSGYKGRLGLHELLFATPEVKRMIQLRSPVAEILACALNAGMRTLKQDGIAKVLAGETDVEKIRAAC